MDAFRDFLATPEGVIFAQVVKGTYYSLDWTDPVSAIYEEFCAPLKWEHRIPLWNALIDLVQAVESGKDNETAQPLLKRVEVLFAEMVQKDELQRAKNNGGRPWSGAAKRAFGDIANLRIRMLGL